MTTTTTDLDEARWQAVSANRARRGDRFFYAVTSTGVFCVPTCTARRPRRENVRFFASAREARDAGFRPCMRCRPDGESETMRLALGAVELIEASRPPTVALDQLAATLATSSSTLRRSFTEVVGVTPRQYADHVRRRRLRADLKDGASVVEAQNNAGYGSGSRLYEAAQGILGTTPRHYRDGADGLTIRYAVADGPLGPYLAAATEHGVCHVSLGPDEDALVGDLRDEFPKAELISDSDALGEALVAIEDLLEQRAPHSDLPFDVRGTAFQRQVWEYLRTIPSGETRTYGEVADAIERPRAVRAVARACATNPLAVLTPCHRVVGADGGLAGYRWGLGIKGALLAREAAREESD